MFVCRIRHDGGVGNNNRIGTQIRRRIHSGVPTLHLTRLCKCIDGHQYIAPARMGVSYAFPRRFHIEIQSRKVSCIGRIFQTHVNRVRTVVHSGFQCRQVAGGADQFWNFLHFVFLVLMITSIGLINIL